MPKQIEGRYMVISWSVPMADKRYAIWDKELRIWLCDEAGEARTYVNLNSARGALSRARAGHFTWYPRKRDLKKEQEIRDLIARDRGRK